MKKVVIAVVLGMLSVISCSPNFPHLDKDGSIRVNQAESTKYIRTRVYVETVVIKTELPEVSFINLGDFINPQKSETILLTIPARSPSEIINDFNIAEKKLELLHVRFCIDELVFIPAHTEPVNSEVDLCNYRDDKYPPKDDSMNIYFIFSNRGKSQYSGIGNLPWSGSSSIVLLGVSGTGSLTHEIGHFFGLYHTFDKSDYVDDTPQVTIPEGTDFSQFLGKKGTDPCYNNVMTYFDDPSESMFTPNQIRRMKHFLLKKPRNDLLMPEYEGYPLNIQVSQAYLTFIDHIQRDILRNPQVPVVCQKDLTEILIRIGFLSPFQPGAALPPSS